MRRRVRTVLVDIFEVLRALAEKRVGKENARYALYKDYEYT